MSYTGTVKSFNPDKDIFLLKSQLQGVMAVSKGQTVSFGLTDNGRGPEAIEVTVIGGGGGAAAAPVIGVPIAPVHHNNGGGMAMHMNTCPAYHTPGPAYTPAPGTYIGEVKSFNPNSGWGHIMCDETHQMYGKDMFFMKSQLPGGIVQKGATVQFMVSQGTKGPEAQMIKILGSWGGGGSGMMAGGRAGGKGGGNYAQPAPTLGPPNRNHQPPPAPQPSYAVVGGCGGVAGGGNVGGCGGCGNPNTVYFGQVKSFREEKGWGHISCPQTHAIYGKDMFVMRSALNGNAVRDGDNVQFNVTLGMKGPEATHVRVIGQIDEHQIYVGSVKMFNQEKGWGFIACDETRTLFGKDIFIHKKDLAGHLPTEGESVQFQVVVSETGRPEGAGLMFGGSYAAWKESPAGEEHYDNGDGQIVPTRAGGRGKGARPGPYV